MKVDRGEISETDAAKFCPGYGYIKEIGEQARQRVEARLSTAPSQVLGTKTHKEAENELNRMRVEETEKLLKARGIRKLHPELKLLQGKPIGYRKFGTSIIDVVEELADGKTVCAYDFKTGEAVFRWSTMERYLSNLGIWANGRNVYIFPIHLGR